jgi:lipopolysaccharide biosynthesis glycosyltransferase
MTIHIAFCHQGRELSGLSVAIFSTLVACSNEHIHVHVHSDMVAEEEERIKDVIAEIKGSDISFYPLNFEPLKGLKLDYTLIYYYRLLLPLLHPTIDKIIYLDTDLIVERDVSELYNEELGECSVAAVRDYIEARKCKDLGCNPPYINTGVMVLDLSKLRKSNFTLYCLKWLDTHCGRSMHHHDQDAVNVFLDGKNVKLLDHSWNLMLPDPGTIISQKDRIIHITGPFKPWNIVCPLAYRNRFQSYLASLNKTRSLCPITPANIAQAIFVANQFLNYAMFEESITAFLLALNFRWSVVVSDDPEFTESVIKMRSLISKGRIRAAAIAIAEAFEITGYSRSVVSPFQYNEILEI